MSIPEQITFFRYQGIVMAFNHNPKEFDDYAVLSVQQCKQYPQFQKMMGAAVRDLENKQDGKWVFSTTGGWQHFWLTYPEEVACELALDTLLVEEREHLLSQ
ncbi:hypothetical protein NUACC21_59650 [Scytonema sp. NUACC21]